MRVLVVTLLALLSAPCQRWNPELCDGDHRCSRDRYCDRPKEESLGRCRERTDGGASCTAETRCPDEQPLCAIEEGVCGACAIGPGDDDRCRRRDPATPRCLGPRCVECLPAATSGQSSDCSAALPICDKSDATCRPCRRHGECQSGVCAKDDRAAGDGLPQGACVPTEQVLVVDQSACNDLGPVFCTPTAAIARMDRGHRYLLFRLSARNMEPLFSELDIGLNEPQRGIDLTLIGPLADGAPDDLSEAPPVSIGGVRGRRGFIIWPRTRVTLEGFVIQGSQTGVECLGDQNIPTELRVVRSLLGDNRVALSLKNNCHLSLSSSWLGRRPPRGTFAGTLGNRLAIEVQGSDLDVESSVLSGNGATDAFGGIRILGLGNRALSTVVNTTFYGQGGRADGGMGRSYTNLMCDGAMLDRLIVLNSLFFHAPAYPTPADGHIAPGCGGQYFAVGSEDPGLSANQSIVIARPLLPGFLDAGAQDLRLDGNATAPAQRSLHQGGLLQLLLRGQTVIAPTTDLRGHKRPDDHIAIGAYEPEP